MSKQSIIVMLCICASVLLIASLTTNAGPLTPPAGAPAPTNKTLTEIEPRLAVNATNTPGGANAVFEITQPGSYYLEGNIVGQVGLSGIHVNTIGHVAIDLNGFVVIGVVNSNTGILVTGNVSLDVHDGGIRDWGDNGLLTSAGLSARVSNVLVRGNGLKGINVGTDSVIESCVARDNTGDGIEGGDSSVITGCASFSNNGNGIRSGTGSHVSGNSSRFNGGDGFLIVGGSYIFNNLATANTGDGIETAGDSYVLNNNCDNNGIGAAINYGIRVTSTDTRIEGNNVLDNDRGIVTIIGGCFIVKNTASGNASGDYSFSGTDVYGPIVVFSAGDLSTSLDPNNSHPMANFSY